MPKFRQESGFKCLNCGYSVSTDPIISGVQSRNHCPMCLWSRHVDLHTAGDRMAGCMGMMKPIGLTLKRTRKKYANSSAGEIMLIHACQGCGKVSICRIAADDHAETIWQLFESSLEMDAHTRSQLEESGVQTLTAGDGQIVRRQLYGEG